MIESLRVKPPTLLSDARDGCVTTPLHAPEDPQDTGVCLRMLLIIAHWLS